MYFDLMIYRKGEVKLIQLIMICEESISQFMTPVDFQYLNKSLYDESRIHNSVINAILLYEL